MSHIRSARNKHILPQRRVVLEQDIEKLELGKEGLKIDIEFEEWCTRCD